MAPNDPRLEINKAELIARIQLAREELEEVLLGLSPADLARPGPEGGWAVQDHLAHLAEWRWKLLAMMNGRPGYEGLQISAEQYSAGLDPINALLYERNQARSTEDILANFRRAHQAVLDALAPMTDADLKCAYDLTDPTDERSLLEGIIGNTYAHDLEHLAWIQAILNH
jgi:hypothetical protein